MTTVKNENTKNDDKDSFQCQIKNKTSKILHTPWLLDQWPY